MLFRSANGSHPVSNFGQQLPLLTFWEVPEVRRALADLVSFSVSSEDWQVFGYIIGRAGLWVSVATSLWSMTDYIRYFAATKKAD